MSGESHCKMCIRDRFWVWYDHHACGKSTYYHALQESFVYGNHPCEKESDIDRPESHFIYGNQMCIRDSDRDVFKKALKATAIHRGSQEKIVDVNGIIEQISSNANLKSMWEKYQKKFAYASDISYESIMEILSALILENSLQC